MLNQEKLEAYHRYKNHMKETRKRIRGALNHWSRLGLTEATSEAFELYRDKRIAERAAASTVKAEMNKLLGLARWLGYRPEVRLPIAPKKIPVAWTRWELRRLFREARQTKRTVWGIPGRIYWPALLNLTYDTAERIGAVLRIQAASIDLARRLVVYPADTRKGGFSEAMAPISRRTAKDIRRLLQNLPPRREQKTLFVYGDTSGLWTHYNNLLTDAGLPHDRYRKFHCLRRTHATQVHKAGGDATLHLGHSSDSVTRASYIDPRQIMRKLPWRPWLWWSW